MKGKINCAFISEKLSKRLKHAEDDSAFVAVMANQTNQEENRNEQIIR